MTIGPQVAILPHPINRAGFLGCAANGDGKLLSSALPHANNWSIEQYEQEHRDAVASRLGDFFSVDPEVFIRWKT